MFVVRVSTDFVSHWVLHLCACVGTFGVHLFLRHFPMVLAVGTACVISSVSMIAGTLLNAQAGIVAWDIVLLAAPGAMVGALLARPIALWLGPRKLKTAGGVWIIVSALYLLIAQVS